MRVSKVKSYLGFAIKGNKVIFGYDKLFENKKNPKLVIICSSLNEKNTNKVQEFSEKYNIICIKLKEYILGDLISRDNCKVIGICDDNLASAICNELEMLNGKQ